MQLTQAAGVIHLRKQSNKINLTAHVAGFYHPLEHEILSEILAIESLVAVGQIDDWTQLGETEEFFVA